MDSIRSIWNEAPAVRLLLPLMAGVMFAISVLHFVFEPLILFHHVQLCIAIACALLFACLGFLFYTNQLKNPAEAYRLRFYSGLTLQLSMFLLGALLLVVHTDIYNSSHIIHLQNKTHYYTAIVKEPPVRKEKTTFLNAELIATHDSADVQPVSGTILLLTTTDSASQNLKYGSILSFYGAPELLDPPKNPYEFDYAQYQHFHNIYYRLYLNDSNWKIVAQNQGNKILASIYQLRDFFLSLILQHVKTKDEIAVASAIMLGYRDYMNAEIVQAYASSGALHVLSVSGLHVGVLFVALQFLLGWMDKTKRLRNVKVFIVIFIMLFYAVLTGLSPSVLRAVVMFSFFVIAKAINRDKNMFNVLAASCLILLLWNPYLITEVGFKLSYLAVLGIITLYPIFNPVLTFKNPFLSAAWSIVALSFAAQIATFPVSLYYFHQFPNLFLISNLVVIPLSDIVLYLGMLLCVIFKISFLFNIVGWVFNALLLVIDKFIYFVDSLPFALIEEIQVTQTEMYLIYLLLGLMYLYFKQPKGKYFVLLLCASLFYVSVRAIRLLENEHQTLFITYSVPKHSAITFVHNTVAYTAIDSTLLQNKSSMLFHIRHHWWALGIKQISSMQSPNTFVKEYDVDAGTLYAFSKKRILKLDKSFSANSLLNKIHVDELVISGNQKQHIASLANSFHFQKIVFDTSNKPWRVKKWKQTCDTLRIPYHDVAEYAFIKKTDD